MVLAGACLAWRCIIDGKKIPNDFGSNINHVLAVMQLRGSEHIVNACKM